ncbi:unnamed protein product [Cyclocybe aegerita]|uniref:F-box domain-containing protein n=1 Tax=Cyclocybe aegerita TaxID=1973307 RepID=A0A8S0VSK4_CYCAE|nr:unnamed protein product [Cyclocybe aegerita]
MKHLSARLITIFSAHLTSHPISMKRPRGDTRSPSSVGLIIQSSPLTCPSPPETIAMSHSFENLFPELYPLIASHIPLHATPQTLLSLAITNRHFSEFILPLVHQCLILRDEDSIMKALHKISVDSAFGIRVRELHLICMGSISKKDDAFDTIKELEKVVAAGALPNLHTLGLRSCEYESNPDDHPNFWAIVNEHCRWLRRIRLMDVYGAEYLTPKERDFHWLRSSGVFQIPDVSTLSFRVTNVNLKDQHCTSFLSTLTLWTHSLQTLSLSLLVHEDVSLSAFYCLNFPCLRSLTLDIWSVNQPSEAMDFWTRHPNLESLTLCCADGVKCFVDSIPRGFLPHLRHLKASYVDVRALAPVLPQLTSLAVHDGINSQVPYLLRSVIPGGLPGLKSLYFVRGPWDKNAVAEGTSWYETYDGAFHEIKKKKKKSDKSDRNILRDYMLSIARGTPNIEELGFPYVESLSGLVEVSDVFSDLRRLKRIYYGMHFEDGDDPNEATIAHVLALAKESFIPCLESVTNLNDDIPYPVARIIRDENGNPCDVVLGTGGGMEVGNEDSAFLFYYPNNVTCSID